jgi:Spy/CpxP family protein refolding chaperone
MTLGGNVKLKIWLVLVAVFALGAATGAALGGLYQSRAGSRQHGDKQRDGRGGPEAQFERMRRELKLTDEQATKVRAVLEETREEYRRLRTELRPRFEEPRLRARARMRELLTPEQQQLFDRHAAERDARREERERGR